MVSFYICCGLAGLLACTALLCWLFDRAPLVEWAETNSITKAAFRQNDRENDVIEQVNHVIAKSAYLREQLEANAHQMVELHGCDRGSCDADDLESVVWDGEDYSLAMGRIMSRKRSSVL